MKSRFKAAIVGIGNVGLLFDEDPKRRRTGEIWTHFSAYERLEDRYDLVAVVDPDATKLHLAKNRNPKITCFSSIEKMLAASPVDVVSVCTPDAAHLECLESLADRVKGIFLEKPVCSLDQLERARGVIRSIRNRGVSVRVNYYKRKEPLFVLASRNLEGDEIVFLSAKYSGPFEAVGSHAVNLLIGMVPSLRLIRSIRHSSEEGVGITGFFDSEGGCSADLIYCGLRHDLIFELDVIGRRRRAVLERNFASLRLYEYRDSSRYKDYREMELIRGEDLEANSERFMPFLREIAAEIEKSSPDYGNLEDALKTQALMTKMVEEQNG